MKGISRSSKGNIGREDIAQSLGDIAQSLGWNADREIAARITIKRRLVKSAQLGSRIVEHRRGA